MTLDPKGGRLTAQVDGDGTVRSSTTTLPALPADAWRTLTVEATADGLTAEVTESDLADVVARVRWPATPVLPRAGAAQQRPGRRRQRRRQPGRGGCDDARGGAAGGSPARGGGVRRPGLAGFTWVRPNPAVTVSGGSLRWPVEGTDLVGGGNTASVLLHDTPGDGDWIAEAKTTLDLGVDTVRNYQQVGLVAYENDDDFARLSNVAIWNTRQTEFGRETAATRRPGPAPDELWRRHHRHVRGYPVAAARPPPQRRRRAPLPGGHQPRRGELDVGRDVGLPRRHRPAHRPRRARRRRPAVTAEVDHLRFYASRGRRTRAQDETRRRPAPRRPRGPAARRLRGGTQTSTGGTVTTAALDHARPRRTPSGRATSPTRRSFPTATAGSPSPRTATG